MWPGLWGSSFGTGRHIVGMRQTLRQETRKRLPGLSGRRFCTHTAAQGLPGWGWGTVGAMLKQRIRLWEQVCLEAVTPGSLKSVHGCLSVPIGTTGCRHCPAKDAGVSVYGISFTGSCTDSALPGPGHPKEAHLSPMLTAARA